MTDAPATNELLALADKITSQPTSWLPISGHVRNITFTLGECELIFNALRSAATPSAQGAEPALAQLDSADLSIHRVMTPEEYSNFKIQGWHAVCKDIDGFGGVGVQFGLLPDASPGNGAEKVREALAYTSTNNIAACRCGEFPHLYDDGARPDDGYRSLWCQTCMNHVTEMMPSEREVIEHWNDLREKEHAASRSTSAAGETTSSDGPEPTSTIPAGACEPASAAIRHGGPSEAIPADAGKRISQLAADLVVSGWMAGDHGIERAKKEAEDKLLAFACDEIERHMKQRSVPADVLAMKEACKMAVLSERKDCLDAIDAIARNRTDSDTQRGNERFYHGGAASAGFILAAIDKLSPEVKAEGGRTAQQILGDPRIAVGLSVTPVLIPDANSASGQKVEWMRTHPASPPDVEAIRADERERCARVVEQFGQPYALNTNTGAMMFRAEVGKIASAIRTGGQK